MRFLCVSDIHGHAAALQAVLDAARERGDWDVLVCCGDMLFPGPEPLETWRLLVKEHAVCVQGASDRALALLDVRRLRPTTDAERARVDRLVEVRGLLGPDVVARLASLEPIARLHLESGAELVISHGSPMDPLECMSLDLSDEELGLLVGDDPGEVFVCGGSHVPFERRLDELALIVNVGSVGEAPPGGFADAAFIETDSAGVIVSPFTVPLGP